LCETSINFISSAIFNQNQQKLAYRFRQLTVFQCDTPVPILSGWLRYELSRLINNA